MAKSNKKRWIVGISGSEMDDVVTHLVEATDYQIRSLLAKFCKEDAKNDDFEYGDTRIDEVKKRDFGEGYYAGSTFSDHHNDYTAIPVTKVLSYEEAKLV